jgi:hypothetical protein
MPENPEIPRRQILNPAEFPVDRFRVRAATEMPLAGFAC